MQERSEFLLDDGVRLLPPLKCKLFLLKIVFFANALHQRAMALFERIQRVAQRTPQLGAL